MEVTGVDLETAERIFRYAEMAAEAAPQEQSTRSSILSNPLPAGSSGESSSSSGEKVRTMEELFGSDPAPAEEKVTADDVFNDQPTEASNSTETAEQAEAGDEDTLSAEALETQAADETDSEQAEADKTS